MRWLERDLKWLENRLASIDKEIEDALGSQNKGWMWKVGNLRYKRADIWIDYMEIKYKFEGLI